jgi:hypothetical protein
LCGWGLLRSSPQEQNPTTSYVSRPSPWFQPQRQTARMSATVVTAEGPQSGDSQLANAAMACNNCCGGEVAWHPWAFS